MTYRLMLLTLAGGASLLAQRPNPPAPPADVIKTYLNLTDSQMQALQQVQQQESQSVRSAMQKIRQSQETLQNMLDARNGDAVTLGNLLLDIQAQQSSIAKNRAIFAPQAANILTPDQKTKLQALVAAQQLEPAIQQAIGLLLIAPEGGRFRGPEASFFGRRGPRPGPPPNN